MNTKTKKFIPVTLLTICVFLFGSTANAHGFGERYDLPIPLSYFLIGAALAVALSFAAIGWFVRSSGSDPKYPRINVYRYSAMTFFCKIISRFLGLISVFILFISIHSGLMGTSEVIENFAPVFVWIIWWVGVGYVVCIVGNVWLLMNPWMVIFNYWEQIFGKHIGIVDWPKKLDAWPALFLFLLFAWIENVHTASSQPFSLGILILIYSLLTWVGMILFGKHVWLTHGDPFYVLFNLFARFSATELRINETKDWCMQCSSGCKENLNLPDCVDCYECWANTDSKNKEFCLRPWSVGLSRGERVTPAIMLFYVTALATVSFDGFSETPAWVEIQTVLWPVIDPLPGPAAATIKTIGIIFVPFIFTAIYLYVCGLISQMSRGQMAYVDIRMRFVFSLVPIALAYNLSHNLSSLLITGQEIIPLLSDPYGVGWNLFGTSDFKINIAIIDARFIWVFSVIALVAGHIISVFTAHVIALRRTTSHSIAVRSQYPMLLLMVFFTAVSLWIVAQPIVE